MIGIVSVKSLNAWLLGDNYARSIGIKISQSRLLIILSTAILTGGVTAFCGPNCLCWISRTSFNQADHQDA